MLSLFDREMPMPEKAKTLTLYKGTLEDLLVFIQNNPKVRGKFLSDSESSFEMEARAKEIHIKLGLDPEALNLGLAFYHPETSRAWLANSLNCDAARFLPLRYVVVTENEKWTTKIWGAAQSVPKEAVK